MGSQVDVEGFWEALAATAGGLQGAGRLPRDDGHLYEPGLEVVKQHLKDRSPSKATDEAGRLVRRNKAAAFLAFELIKEYYLATGSTGRAGTMARVASRLLKACGRAEARRLKPNRRGWR
jgi:hypothetical protein